MTAFQIVSLGSALAIAEAAASRSATLAAIGSGVRHGRPQRCRPCHRFRCHAASSLNAVPSATPSELPSSLSVFHCSFLFFCSSSFLFFLVVFCFLFRLVVFCFCCMAVFNFVLFVFCFFAICSFSFLLFSDSFLLFSGRVYVFLIAFSVSPYSFSAFPPAALLPFSVNFPVPHGSPSPCCLPASHSSRELFPPPLGCQCDTPQTASLASLHPGHRQSRRSKVTATPAVTSRHPGAPPGHPPARRPRHRPRRHAAPSLNPIPSAIRLKLSSCFSVFFCFCFCSFKQK